MTGPTALPAFGVPDPTVMAAVQAICGRLPDAVELASEIGRLWRVRRRNFAHVWCVEEPSGPVTVMQFRVTATDYEALIRSGQPFFPAANVNHTIRMFLTPRSDWDHVEELITDSYCLQAPKTLAARVVNRWSDTEAGRPGSGPP